MQPLAQASRGILPYIIQDMLPLLLKGLPASSRLCDLLAHVQLVMNIPFTAVYFSTYESTKKLLGKAEEDEGLLVQLVAGGIAGGAAAAVTNPLDVVKTRLQLEGVNSATRYNSTSFVSASPCLTALCMLCRYCYQCDRVLLLATCKACSSVAIARVSLSMS